MRSPLVCALALALVVSSGFAAPADGRQPNIVIFVADDLGYADVGFAGGKQIQTPEIDRLAAAGARLEQHYVQPLCSPTRAALLTGRYPMRYGLQSRVLRPYEQRGLPLTERLLPQVLKSAGYTTSIVGKWHLGHNLPHFLPTRRGFDRQYGHYNGQIDYFEHTREGGFDWHRDDHECRDEGYSTHLIAREAVRQIETQPADKPFFLYVPFNGVHSPWQVPEEYKRPYASLSEPRRTYAGMLAAVDEAVGRIVRALDKRGLAENTIVLFFSDNGGPAPGRITDNGIFRGGKGGVYEGGTRVCAAARWVGRIKPGSAVSVPVHVVDWYPTLLKLAGASLEQPLPIDGKDIWPVLAEGRTLEPREILLNTTEASGAIRVGDWKLVVHRHDAEEAEGDGEADASRKKAAKAKRARAAQDGERVELFNLATDPGEKNDLAAENPGKVAELRQRYDSYVNAAVPPTNQERPADFRTPKVWGQ